MSLPSYRAEALTHTHHCRVHHYYLLPLTNVMTLVNDSKSLPGWYL